MQRIEIIGNLAKDAEEVQGRMNAESFISMRVIVNDKKGEIETTETYEVSYRSTGVLQYLKKGKKVYVTGVPYAKAYRTHEGELKAQMHIRALDLELL